MNRICLSYGRGDMFFLVCFDIVENKARYRAVKILQDYGYRVQKSVFECPGMTEEKYLKMKHRLEDCIDNTQDTVRYYFLCRGCVQRIEYSGVGNPPLNGEFRVI